MSLNSRERSLVLYKLFMVFCLFIIIPGLVHAFAAENNLTLSPVNPEFRNFIQLVREGKPPKIYTTEGYYMGLIPSPLDMSHNRGLSIIPEAKKLTLPPFYDLRDLNRLTPVKDQGTCGSCWAFATYASLESWILSEDAVTWDFSENNLKNCHGFNWAGCEGGNSQMSTAYLVRWDGPVDESDDPYHDWEEYCIPGLEEKKHVQTVLWIPDRGDPLDNDNIKQAVMEYGAVYTSMHYEDSYYNRANYTYYYDGGAPSNHAVAIVGWDDNFDKNLFNTPPPGDGAWIVRNSWGSAWGEDGYFYISYYDSRIGTENALFIDGREPYDFTLYQYDPLGYILGAGYDTDSAWAANIFTPISNGNLISVGLYAATVNTSYEIYVYDTFTGDNFSNLIATKSGTIASPGYHTISLDSPLPLSGGDDFAVVVKFTTPGYNFPIPIEYPLPGYSDAARANPGESYVSNSGETWTDITSVWSNTNVCIKAIASYTFNPDLSRLIVYPNPFKSAEHTEIIFTGLTEQVSIRIFTLSGELVRKVDLSGQISWSWDVKNEKGEDVARGIYIYLITNPAGEKVVGKIAIL